MNWLRTENSLLDQDFVAFMNYDIIIDNLPNFIIKLWSLSNSNNWRGNSVFVVPNNETKRHIL